jgi:hypothetical protein
LTVIRLESAEIPTTYGIASIYPNPFNAAAQVKFGLPEAGEVKLTVYDLSGRRVVELVRGEMGAGLHSAAFNATDLSAGLYIVRLEAAGKVSRQKLTLIK